MTSHTYRVHGLRVRSEVPLPAPIEGGGPDIEVAVGDRRHVPDAPPDGDLLAHLDLPVGSSSLVSRRGGYLLRIHGLCEFEIDLGVRTIVAHLALSAEEELLAVLLGGALSTALTLAGRCILHASAVEWGDGAIAFVGASGMGKTTVAALCCAAGAALVADDALWVEYEDERAWCATGFLELRLRTGADSLTPTLKGKRRVSSLDQRVCIRPIPTTSSRLPIRAVVTPQCVRDLRDLQVARLRAAEAVLELLRYPRSLGWIDPGPARRSFDVLTEVASVMPVYRASIPWGPSFDPSVAANLLAAVQTGVGGEATVVE